MLKRIKKWWLPFMAFLLYNGRIGAALLQLGPSWRGRCVPGVTCTYCRYAQIGCPLGAAAHTLTGFPPSFSGGVWAAQLGIGLLSGRLICGKVCPFGWFQDLLHAIPVPKLAFSGPWRMLSYGKYLVLLALVLGWTQLEVLMPYWPWLAGGMLVWALAAFRPFCRFLCPMGAIYSLFSRHSIGTMKIDEAACCHCNACIRICPMQCRAVGDRECIACGRCAEICPTKAISYTVRYKK